MGEREGYLLDIEYGFKRGEVEVGGFFFDVVDWRFYIIVVDVV